MAACSRHVEVIVRNRLFFMHFAFIRGTEEITYTAIDSPVHGEYGGANFESPQHCIRYLHLF